MTFSQTLINTLAHQSLTFITSQIKFDPKHNDNTHFNIFNIETQTLTSIYIVPTNNIFLTKNTSNLHRTIFNKISDTIYTFNITHTFPTHTLTIKQTININDNTLTQETFYKKK